LFHRRAYYFDKKTFDPRVATLPFTQETVLSMSRVVLLITDDLFTHKERISMLEKRALGTSSPLTRFELELEEVLHFQMSFSKLH
jgi:hypothetical protein